MKDFTHLKDIADIPIEDYRRYRAHLEDISIETPTHIIQEFDLSETGRYYRHIWKLDKIDSELQWATHHFSLSEFEQKYIFRRCYNYCLLQECGWYPVEVKQGWYPNPKLLEGMSEYNMLLMIAIYRVLFRRMIEFTDNFLPQEHIDKWGAEDSTGMSDDLQVLHDLNPNDEKPLLGESLSEFCSENNRLLLFLDRAKEVIIRLTDKKISEAKVNAGSTGTLIANDVQLEMLNDLRDDGNEFLAMISRGGQILSGDDLQELRVLWKSQMYFPYETEPVFVFGRKRNTIRKHFINSLKPLYTALKGRFRKESPDKFGSYTNRDYHRYIIELLHIPEVMATEQDLEYHFK